ncbi:MAG: tRNA (N6-isopentenyl adenosine(37)-C2)-methylthiotransferase MiaB [Proteobacteria bacterium]|nr:tRNA (N6-isopentenyl adenosine(37)-C2)-methylthiotransferase MiaB [Pseudomonadota bacterium]
MDSLNNLNNDKAAIVKKVHIETWGCQMNVADSEKMLSLLQQRNYELTLNVDEADLVLLNTCHIREKARHKVLSRLGVLNQLKNKKPELKIAVSGCVAQADGKKLIELAPQIDILIGPGKIDQIGHFIDATPHNGVPQVALGFDRHSEEQNSTSTDDIGKFIAPTVSGKKEVTRFVNVIQGCNNFCTFCVVPFTRGREVSKEKSQILNEVRGLVDQGVREITLLGQNVNSYGLDFIKTEIVPQDGGPFVELLKAVSEVQGLERIRFTTSNPHDFTRPLANLFASNKKMGRYIHLPVQSGNDHILERMKRKVTVSEYLGRINWLKEAVPDIAISTDLIVGFPGETEEEFEDTLKLISEVEYSFVYAFKYSARKGTAAARFSNHLSEEIMEARLKRLNDIQNAITLKQNQAEIGQVRDVLFFYENSKIPGMYVGRSEHYRTVRVKSERNLVGLTLPVIITASNKIAMEGILN